LHTISSDEEGLVRLALSFEQLLQSHQPHLYLHLQSIGVEPVTFYLFVWPPEGFTRENYYSHY
jgi:hypothetical protein